MYTYIYIYIYNYMLAGCRPPPLSLPPYSSWQNASQLLVGEISIIPSFLPCFLPSFLHSSLLSLSCFSFSSSFSCVFLGRFQFSPFLHSSHFTVDGRMPASSSLPHTSLPAFLISSPFQVSLLLFQPAPFGQIRRQSLHPHRSSSGATRCSIRQSTYGARIRETNQAKETL